MIRQAGKRLPSQIGNPASSTFVNQPAECASADDVWQPTIAGTS
jgi:hypothetical protein